MIISERCLSWFADCLGFIIYYTRSQVRLILEISRWARLFTFESAVVLFSDLKQSIMSGHALVNMQQLTLDFAVCLSIMQLG